MTWSTNVPGDVMRFAFSALACVLLQSVVCLPACSAKDSYVLDGIVVTSAAKFRIPFVANNRNPGGVALLVSSDSGTTWQAALQAQLRDGGFVFEAPQDGFYQFAVRPVGPAGRIVQESGPMTPELSVLVDTTRPTLQLSLTELRTGTVSVSWEASDLQLDPSSLKLEYSESSDGRWRPLDTKAGEQGATTISCQPGTAVSVRASVADAAGNVTTREEQVAMSRPAVSPQNVPAPSASAPPATPFGPTPFRNASSKPVSTAGIVSGTAQPPVTPSRNNIYPDVAPAMSKERQNGNSRTVNARAFDIEYQVDDVGPSGIGSVDLFITEDGGRQWFRYGSDQDSRSPFAVEVPEDGHYGFAIRVRNGIGLVDPPPQPGEAADVTVVVDTAAPLTTMQLPETVADNGGAVILRWEMSDANPAAAPVRLEYAADPSGPWQVVLDWQPDPGGHHMPITPGMPANVFFRLLARDDAGNISHAQTTQPTTIDMNRPSARVLAIEPSHNRSSY